MTRGMRGLTFLHTLKTPSQVLEFFTGYGVPGNLGQATFLHRPSKRLDFLPRTGRVHIKVDYMGRPSGEAFVEFANNDEAAELLW